METLKHTQSPDCPACLTMKRLQQQLAAQFMFEPGTSLDLQSQLTCVLDLFIQMTVAHLKLSGQEHLTIEAYADIGRYVRDAFMREMPEACIAALDARDRAAARSSRRQDIGFISPDRSGKVH